MKTSLLFLSGMANIIFSSHLCFSKDWKMTDLVSGFFYFLCYRRVTFPIWWQNSSAAPLHGNHNNPHFPSFFVFYFFVIFQKFASIFLQKGWEDSALDALRLILRTVFKHVNIYKQTDCRVLWQTFCSLLAGRRSRIYPRTPAGNKQKYKACSWAW